MPCAMALKLQCLKCSSLCLTQVLVFNILKAPIKWKWYSLCHIDRLWVLALILKCCKIFGWSRVLLHSLWRLCRPDQLSGTQNSQYNPRVHSENKKTFLKRETFRSLPMAETPANCSSSFWDWLKRVLCLALRASGTLSGEKIVFHISSEFQIRPCVRMLYKNLKSATKPR